MIVRPHIFLLYIRDTFELISLVSPSLETVHLIDVWSHDFHESKESAVFRHSQWIFKIAQLIMFDGNSTRV